MRLNSEFSFLACVVSGAAANNWAGVILNEDAGSFYSVSANLHVPHVWSPNGSASGVAATISLDNDQCDSYLQAGILANVTDSGTEYQAFYKWSPDDMVILSDITFIPSGITVSDDDTVYISTDASSDLTSAHVVVQNLKNHQTSSHKVSTGRRLCGQSVAWIVDNPTLASGWVPLANFTTARFTNSVAIGGNGQVYQPQGGDILQMTDSDGNGLTYAVANNDTVIVVLSAPE